jgi:hypothetical protein
MFSTYATENGYDGSPGMVSLNHADHAYYPYADTYQYLHVASDGTGMLCDTESYLPDGPYRVLTSVSGGYERHNDYIECTECGYEYRSDDDDADGYRNLCASCVSDYTCRDCGTYDYHDVRDGYCDDCRQDHMCRECGDVTDDDMNNGYCDDCSTDILCTDCGGADADRNDAGLCTQCAERVCITCKRLQTYTESSEAYRNNPARHNECVSCQTLRPMLFDAGYLSSFDAGRCFRYDVDTRPSYTSRYSYVIPATGFTSIADVTETEPEPGNLPFADTLNADASNGYFGSRQYRYVPLTETR